MQIERTGIILNTENYRRCVEFYETLFNLEILYAEDGDDFKLTCFDFLGSYLMIETGGTAKETGRSVSESPAKIRINVSDIQEALEKVLEYGIDAKILQSSWGATINIIDPDGNRVGIRDEKTFAEQLTHDS